jgi:hypothetical protein
MWAKPSDEVWILERGKVLYISRALSCKKDGITGVLNAAPRPPPMTTAPVSCSVGFCGNFLIGSSRTLNRAGANMLEVKIPASVWELSIGDVVARGRERLHSFV